MWQIEEDEMVKMEKIEFTKELLQEEKGSKFVAKSAQAHSLQQVREAYLKMRYDFPNADHIVMAYRVGDYEGSCDDEEYFAGDKLLRLLISKNTKNVVTFVARKYGGVHLGPRRFVIYQKMVEASIKTLGKKLPESS